MKARKDNKPVTTHEAKTHFSKLLRKVQAGHEIEIAKGSEVVAKLIPFRPKRKRALGRDRDLVSIAKDFDAPLPKEVLDSFESNDK